MAIGICTLANDTVYDQVVALINSIEVNAGSQLPVCIFPYDDQLERLQELVRQRPQVQIYQDTTSIARWDNWVEEVWAVHPTAQQRWEAIGSRDKVHRMGTHRRFCAFDGPFEKFFYMDADTLLLSPADTLFPWLEAYDWVTYDFQYKDLSHVYELSSQRLSQIFTPAELHRQAFCSGFYGSHQGLFCPEQLNDYLKALSQGEAELLYPMAPDQTILNYLVMKSGTRSINLAQALPLNQRTGNSVTSAHFQQDQGQVYDKGQRLTYLHYIGVSSRCFQQLCRGQNMDIPYRDVFLHYRYWHAPAERPILSGRLRPCQQQSHPIGRWLRKAGLKR